LINLYENKYNCTLEIFGWNDWLFYCRKYENNQYTPHYYDNDWHPRMAPMKPLILLYPKNQTKVKVRLSYEPWYSATFPKYSEKVWWWDVLVNPDSTLIDLNTWDDTYGLFWEWNPSIKTNYDLSKWFVVKWSEIREFLYKKLRLMWLTTKEYSDFIMYWYPKLQNYPYVQITFAWSDYTNQAKLSIDPKPDSLLRVFMIAKPLKNYKEIQEQHITHFERKWFTVLEWGWTIIE
jgi:hypothetical protein